MLPGVTGWRPPRVLMTADAVGGVWTYARDLAEGLSGHGVEVTIAVLGPSAGPERVAALRRLPGVSVVETELPLEWLADGPEEVLGAGRALARLAAETGADLVHLNSPALAADTRYPVPIVAVAHSCVATWWQAVRSGPLPADLAWRAEVTGRGYRAADAVLAPTRAFAEATARAYRLSSLPEVVHNGRRPPRSPARAPAGGPPAYAFTAGRLWDEGKNLALLDRVAARLPFPVLAAGPTTGPNGAAIALRHVRALGLLPEEDLHGRLAGAAAFVSLPRYEPFGLAVLEAAQAGLPLVLSDISTLRELWDGAALFVAAEDEVGAASALGRALAERDLAARLGTAARERAGRYTVETMTAGVLEVYARLVGQGATFAPSARPNARRPGVPSPLVGEGREGARNDTQPLPDDAPSSTLANGGLHCRPERRAVTPPLSNSSPLEARGRVRAAGEIAPCPDRTAPPHPDPLSPGGRETREAAA